MEAARFFGAEAEARCRRLTVRKLYQREFHFFDGDKGGLGGWVAWVGGPGDARCAGAWRRLGGLRLQARLRALLRVPADPACPACPAAPLLSSAPPPRTAPPADVADSRRHALEWAVGLDAVDAMLASNPEARAKLNERLTGPSTGGGTKRARTAAAGGTQPPGSSGRRVLLAGPGARGAQQPALLAAAAALPAASMALPAASLRLPSDLLGATQLGLLPGTLGAAAVPELSLLQQADTRDYVAAGAAAQPAASLGFTDWLRQVAGPSCSVLAPTAGEAAVSSGPAEVQQQLPMLQPATEQPAAAQQQVPARLTPIHELMQPPPLLLPSAALPCPMAEPPAAQQQPAQAPPAPASQESPRPATAPAPAAAQAAPAEVVPLDAVLEAWERHDAVRCQLAAAHEQLEERQQQAAALQQQLRSAQAQLAALQGAGQALGACQLLPSAAAAAALQHAVPSQLARLLQHHPQLLPFAGTICELAGQAVGAALAAASSPTTSTPSPTA